MIVSIVSAFISTIGFSIVFHIQKKHLLICGTVGALGWAIYLLLERMGASTVIASFVAA